MHADIAKNNSALKNTELQVDLTFIENRTPISPLVSEANKYSRTEPVFPYVAFLKENVKIYHRKEYSLIRTRKKCFMQL